MAFKARKTKKQTINLAKSDLEDKESKLDDSNLDI